MLTGDTGKYLGILAGVVFASLLIIQQLSTFSAIMTQTYSGITAVGANIWVMDREVKYIDDSKPITDNQLARVRSVDGVAWAVPLYKGNISSRLDGGHFTQVTMYGLDDTTLIGGPAVMPEGRLSDLRSSDAVIVDQASAADNLAHLGPDGKKIPLRVGDTLELNDHRAVVVGICKVSRGFQSIPIVYTTYHRAIAFAPVTRKNVSFILVSAQPGRNPGSVCRNIQAITGLGAYTSDDFVHKTLLYFVTETGIVIGFGLSVLIAFFVGTLIAGQTFHNFIADNLRHFGALKAMGATNGVIVSMIAIQAASVCVTGFGMGAGLASLLGFAMRQTAIGFVLPWQMVAGTLVAVILICLFASILSIRTVVRLEPAIVFKG